MKAIFPVVCLLLALLGCPSVSWACDDGELQACVCDDGAEGKRICKEAGDGWTKCACDKVATSEESGSHLVGALVIPTFLIGGVQTIIGTIALILKQGLTESCTWDYDGYGSSRETCVDVPVGTTGEDIAYSMLIGTGVSIILLGTAVSVVDGRRIKNKARAPVQLHLGMGSMGVSGRF